ncbi:MMPL family transporter [Nocardioides sp. YIM 152588]|uniref:MMPL family transporter n=1 Tax=Nocardioides sp. YIM 152588 TaxID=3158259 RepID=UPI0032E42909
MADLGTGPDTGHGDRHSTGHGTGLATIQRERDHDGREAPAHEPAHRGGGPAHLGGGHGGSHRHRGPVAVSSFLTSRRWAWLVALVPLVAALAVMGIVGEAERTPSPTDSMPSGLDSTLGVELSERLPDADASTAVVVYQTTGGRPGISALLPDLEPLATDLGAVPAGDPGTGRPSTLLVSDDDTAALAVVPISGGSATDVANEVTNLRSGAAQDLPAGVETLVTGPAAVQADLAEVFQGADIRLLLATATVVALLLVITYRSPFLWAIPLLVVGIADRFAAVAATQTLAALEMAWDESTVGILSVLVFGAGTDYALLLISRYRDELRREPSRHLAMARALRRTARAVLSSSITVVVGVATLALSLTPTTRGLGVACAVGVVIAAFAALVVLPAALVLFGRWVFWPRVPRVEESAVVDEAARRTLWHRLGSVVARRPGIFAAGTLALVAALAGGVLQVQTGLDTADQFLDKPEAIAGAERIEQSFPAGVASPTQVVSTAAPEQVLATVEGVDAVSSARLSAQGAGVTEVSVVLDAAPGSAAAEAAVLELRDAVGQLPDGHVTGPEAEAIDEDAGAARDRLLIFPLILGLVLVALVFLLRSVVAPVLLVATVVATYAASLGASWWIFTQVFGFGALDSGAPLLSFLFLVALGVDYNIFLLARATEDLTSAGPRDAMLRALAATGGVITSAGILLAAVFLVLGVLPLVVLAQLGVIVCIGVLLDTLVVRTVLVPALAFLLGPRFWWPRLRGGATQTAGAAH